MDNIINNIEADMHKVIEKFKSELSALHAGRASHSLIDNIKINYCNNQMSIKSLANISISDTRTIVVTPWEKKMIGPIAKGISGAELGFNTTCDDNAIRISIAVLTEERRIGILKLLKTIGENTKILIRNIRRDFVNKGKQSLKTKEISEDVERRIVNNIQKITDKYINNIDDILLAKESEIMAG